MSRRVIERAEWPEFVDAFSRRHAGWLISVAVEDAHRHRNYLTCNVPLRGVVAEVRDDELMIFTGDTMTHFVGNPQLLAIDETEDGADAALTITDHSGARTIVEFRSPMRPELVDGIAAAV